MQTAMTLGNLLDSEMLKVATLTDDTQLYRLYIGDDRYESAFVKLDARESHPEWWLKASAPRSYIDELTISEYFHQRDEAVVVPFLATLAHNFKVPEEKWSTVSKLFYDAIGKSFDKTITIESMRKKNKDALH